MVRSMKVSCVTARGFATQMATRTPLMGCWAVSRMTALQQGMGPSGSCKAVTPAQGSNFCPTVAETVRTWASSRSLDTREPAEIHTEYYKHKRACKN